MIARTGRGMLHLLLGAAAAAVLGWLVWAMVTTTSHTDGAPRVAAAVAVVGGLALLLWLMSLPVLREVAVPLARGLLGVPLPDVVDPRTTSSRLRGLVWVAIACVVGALAALVLLVGVPLGLSVATLPFVGPTTVRIAGVRLGHSGEGAQMWWSLPVGLAVVAVAVAAQPALVRVAAALAGRVLGPSAGERIAVQQRELRDVASRNALARELHDTIGHALTAIDLQAEALLAVQASGEDIVQEAATGIRDRARSAVADLDRALGVLRAGALAAPVEADDDLPTLVAHFPGEPALHVEGPWGSLDPSIRRVAYRTVRESLTNSARHGSGPTQVRVVVGRGCVDIEVSNPCHPGGTGTRGGGRGLLGLQEAVRSQGGRFEAGPTADGRGWRVSASLPVRSGSGERP